MQYDEIQNVRLEKDFKVVINNHRLHDQLNLIGTFVVTELFFQVPP